MKTNIIIYGKGDLAKLMLHYFNADSKYSVVAFCVDKLYLDSENFCNLPLVSLEDLEKNIQLITLKPLWHLGIQI